MLFRLSALSFYLVAAPQIGLQRFSTLLTRASNNVVFQVALRVVRPHISPPQARIWTCGTFS